MVTELETIMIYLQTRYNIIREISRLTDELLGTVEREDVISASLCWRCGGSRWNAMLPVRAI